MLFSPITIVDTRFRNRIAMPPMVRMTPSMPREVVGTDGEITAAVVEHYRRRALAGTAMIIVEATAVDPGGRCWPQGLNAFADEHVAGLARLAASIHGAGAVASIQLVHGGPQARPELSGGETVGPAAVAPSANARVPRALTIGEIEAIQGRFADAAARAVEAGFDIVELHGAHGYLLDSFLSRHRNQRTDTYGGAVAGRMRFLLETCRRVKDRIDGKALLDCRISIHNKLDEGFSRGDLAELLGGLNTAGLDLLHISTDGAFREYFGSGKTIGMLARESTALPLVVAGGLGDPQDAQRLVAEGHADFAAVGSAMLADPDWAEHARGFLSEKGVLP